MLYRFEKGKNIMIHERDRNYFDINGDIIWSFFRDGIGLKFDETQYILKKWLVEVYNMRDFAPNLFIRPVGNYGWFKEIV